jgi:transposase
MVKDTITQEQRMLLTLRQRYVVQRVAIENAITGVLKPLGIIVPRGWANANSFSEAFLETLAKNENVGPILRESILDSIEAYRAVNALLEKLNIQIKRVAQDHPVCRRLMTVPGVGPVISLSFVTAIDNPHRFRRSSDVGAYLGLTPKKYQSGDVDIDVGISKAGSTMTRTHLVQAATVLLYSSKKHSALRAWGTKVAKRRGHHIARIAVARKLSKILYRIWIDETDFSYSASDLAATAEAA